MNNAQKYIKKATQEDLFLSCVKVSMNNFLELTRLLLHCTTDQ